MATNIKAASRNKAAGKGKAASKKAMTKAELIQAIAAEAGDGISRRQVKQVLETLEQIGHTQLKKYRVFLLPGFAKFVVKDRDAQKARQGRHPGTGAPITIRARPAAKVVKARPVKACKDAVG
jgi:nucleoid DNA-binding protein